MPPRRLLIVGDYAHTDFKPVLDWLRSCTQLFCLADIAEAGEYLAVADPPVDCCLLAQARPGRFHQSDVEQLHAAAPLTPLAVLVGAWCDGEMRTGTPLSGISRMYWHEAIAQLASHVNPATDAGSNVCRLPRTALPVERTLAVAFGNSSEKHALVAIRAMGPASFGSLADACRAAGYAAAWLSPAQPGRIIGATALVWEGDVRRSDEWTELQRLARIVYPAPTVAVLNFPRPEDRCRAIAAGAVDILAKPFELADLIALLRLARAA